MPHREFDRFALIVVRVSLFFFALLLITCDKPPRLPYIPPELHHWPRAYKGIEGLRLHVFTTGTITVPSKAIYRGASLLDTSTLDILAFVIEHPRHGLVLVGTGLNRQIVEHAESYLGAFRTTLGRPTMAKGQDIFTQLNRAKLPDEKVQYLILPDLRFDHTGELASFPTAQAVVAAAEFKAVTEQEDNPFSLPDEYDHRSHWQFIDFAAAEPIGTFRAYKDFLSDG